MEVRGWGGGGGREIIYLSLHCHHQNDSCIKRGNDESHFSVSVGSDGQSHRTVSTNHNLFEEKGEPKRKNNNNNNNNDILYSSQWEIIAVVRSHNKENISIILSHEPHAPTYIHTLRYMPPFSQSAYTISKSNRGPSAYQLGQTGSQSFWW